MRLTVIYPAACSTFADEVAARLSLYRCADVTWVATTGSEFTSDLKDAAESGEALAVAVDDELLKGKSSARLLWNPLLERIEQGEAGSIGLVLLAEVSIPPLLRKLRVAELKEPVRSIQRWVIEWNGPKSITKQSQSVELAEGVLESLLTQLVDQTGCVEGHCQGLATQAAAGETIGKLLSPYFEDVQVMHVPHSARVLRVAELSRVAASGRTLWVVTGSNQDLPAKPNSASLLVISDQGSIEITKSKLTEVDTDPLLRAAELLRLFPSETGQGLPFPTYELERILLQLFALHWGLAERLARRAGSYFRNENRPKEAIWVYETLKWQALAQNQSDCVGLCESELSWLYARRPGALPLANLSQSRFEF